MTVCVAAICSDAMVFGASDRMLTAGDIQFEPEQPKIVQLTDNIVAMLAGESALQEELMQMVRANIARHRANNPTSPLGVGNMAMLCSVAYRKARLRRTERAILAPLGLDHNSFISRQREMEPQFVRFIASDLANYQLPRVETIVAGVDSVGPHVFTVNDGDVNCFDAVGFASIGVGSGHSNSQFMFSRHTRSKPMPETLLLVYAAKKRAEVAPGVGEGTDMFSIGRPTGYYPIPAEVLADLKRIYTRTLDKNRNAIRRANQEITQYIDDLIQQVNAATATKAAQEQAPEPPVEILEAPGEALAQEIPEPE